MLDVGELKLSIWAFSLLENVTKSSSSYISCSSLILATGICENIQVKVLLSHPHMFAPKWKMQGIFWLVHRTQLKQV